MKQTTRLTIGLLLLLISFSACKEDDYSDWKVKNELWLENNKTKPGVITTESGLQYKVLYQGWPYEHKPNKNSDILVTYKGTLIDGSTFETASSEGLSLSKSIAGWREGIPKMNGGGIFIFYIPSNLGYGKESKDSKLPPHSTLVFEVKLLDSKN